MNHWNIPANVSELFAAGEAYYSITDPDFPGDNNYGMSLFIDCVEGIESYITDHFGTQILLYKDGVNLQIDSGGLGDFHLHGFDVTIVEE